MVRTWPCSDLRGEGGQVCRRHEAGDFSQHEKDGALLAWPDLGRAFHWSLVWQKDIGGHMQVLPGAPRQA
eukprot:9169188-Alexandrium_andersonii.AAC.1